MNYMIRDQVLPNCMFKDRDLELSYQIQSFSYYKKTIPSFLIATLALFLAFSIPDFLYTGDYNTFLHIFAERLGFVALCAILYFSFGKIKSSHAYLRMINVIEIAFTVFYYLILSNYKNIDFGIRCVEIIIIVTLYFSFPNRWINAALNSFVFVMAFAVFCFSDTARFGKEDNYIQGAVYLAIAFALNAFSFYKINYYKRSQYYNDSMLKKLINTDKLTGAFTRAKFDEDIKKQISYANQNGRSFSIAIFDIDNFKRINDTYGHIEGDSVLTKIVEIVIENKRPKDILSRWGGEEFVILFPSTNIAAAVKVTDRLRVVISSVLFSIGEHVTCSFGVTEYQQGDTPVTLLRRADKLMYDAKAAGKNYVVSSM